MREACKRVKKPMMANMADGGKTPIRSKAELKNIGYALAIFPSTTGLAAAAAAEKALRLLKAEGASVSPDVPLYGFREFQSLIGFEDVWAFERRWAREGRDPPASS
jgi:2-methylisocitrate lyase-like PEP mutase family enzyme